MAVYADYTFYTETYCGSAVPEKDWPYVSRRASAVIDQITFGRLQNGWPVTDAVQLAACAIADAIQAQQNENAQSHSGIKSEDVDGYKVSYDSANTTRSRWAKEQLAAADLYLLRSDPLRYKGENPEC